MNILDKCEAVPHPYIPNTLQRKISLPCSFSLSILERHGTYECAIFNAKGEFARPDKLGLDHDSELDVVMMFDDREEVEGLIKYLQEYLQKF